MGPCETVFGGGLPELTIERGAFAAASRLRETLAAAIAPQIDMVDRSWILIVLSERSVGLAPTTATGTQMWRLFDVRRCGVGAKAPGHAGHRHGDSRPPLIKTPHRWVLAGARRVMHRITTILLKGACGRYSSKGDRHPPPVNSCGTSDLRRVSRLFVRQYLLTLNYHSWLLRME